jgi:1,4-alpha-glucan branching enzyme
VRHPEHEKFLEESWLFEAITETYLPLIQIIENWRRDRLDARLTLSLSPTLCAMLLDPLLRERYARHLDGLIDLAEKEIHRTHWDRAFREQAWMYHDRFAGAGNVAAIRGQPRGRVPAVSGRGLHRNHHHRRHARTAAAHRRPSAVSVRAQILTARDHYRSCFGRDPRGIWLPECAYAEGVEQFLQEANIRWFTLDTHGILHATPPRATAPSRRFSRPTASPRSGATTIPRARSGASTKAIPATRATAISTATSALTWISTTSSRTCRRRTTAGSPASNITASPVAPGPRKSTSATAALQAASGHAQHFLDERVAQIHALEGLLDRPPIIVAPYDAELFGHWWYEGPEFLDFLVRKLCHEQSLIS